jgi:hypothetical protein
MKSSSLLTSVFFACVAVGAMSGCTADATAGAEAASSSDDALVIYAPLVGWNAGWDLPTSITTGDSWTNLAAVSTGVQGVTEFFWTSEPFSGGELPVAHASLSGSTWVVESLGGAPMFGISATSGAIGTRYVVGFGDHGAPSIKYRSLGWTGWMPLGGAVESTAIAYAASKAHVFGVGTDHRVYHQAGIGNQWPGTWQALPALPAGYTCNGSISATVRGGGFVSGATTIDLVVSTVPDEMIAVPNTLFYMAFNAATGAGAWTSIPSSGDLDGDVHVASTDANTVYVIEGYGQSLLGGTYRAAGWVSTSPGVWSSFALPQKSVTSCLAPTHASEFALGVSAPGTLDLWAPENKLYHEHYGMFPSTAPGVPVCP